MKNYIVFLLLISFLVSCSFGSRKNQFVNSQEIVLNDQEKDILLKAISKYDSRYDSLEKMITRKLSGWNYHTDAQTGIFHDVRSSFTYAVMLLDFGDKDNFPKAFDIIEKTISLQDQNLSSRSCGVWPYYLEEPLAIKKAPIDYNWADFNAVSLFDVWMGHQKDIPSKLKSKIRNSLILAAKSIQKRNVTLSYTNIAIMGTYVTYVVSHLFDLKEMQDYSQDRLSRFYNYTLDKGGFTEYNSPTYTIVALDELDRMKRHIIEPSAKQKIDSLYAIGWSTIARHYHKPTGQWAGPHSRSYRSIISPTFYSILKEASNGEIDQGIQEYRSDVKIKHQIPNYLMHYFLNPEYPRNEIDVFEKDEPKLIGTTFFTNDYVLSTANISSLWNQRRPFLAYWGTVEKPKYLQLRFLHDFYDFSSASFYSQQKENNVLAGVNFVIGGGDKHINIDCFKDGKFNASDLRLRFEFGNVKEGELINSTQDKNKINIEIDGLQFSLNMYKSSFGKIKGHWEIGGDNKNAWVDYIIYSGNLHSFDLSSIEEAVFCFNFSINDLKSKSIPEKVNYNINDGILNAKWQGLELSLPVVPEPLPKNL